MQGSPGFLEDLHDGIFPTEVFWHGDEFGSLYPALACKAVDWGDLIISLEWLPMNL
jgi:hypothetical protein